MFRALVFTGIFTRFSYVVSKWPFEVKHGRDFRSLLQTSFQRGSREVVWLTPCHPVTSCQHWAYNLGKMTCYHQQHLSQILLLEKETRLRCDACEESPPWCRTEHLLDASSPLFLVRLPQDHDVSSHTSQFPCTLLTSACSSPARCLGNERCGSSQLLGIALPMSGSHGQIFTHFFQPHLCVPVMALRGDRGLDV